LYGMPHGNAAATYCNIKEGTLQPATLLLLLPRLMYCYIYCSQPLQASLLILAALLITEGHVPPAAAAAAAAKADVLLQLLRLTSHQAHLLVVAALLIKEGHVPPAAAAAAAAAKADVLIQLLQLPPANRSTHRAALLMDAAAALFFCYSCCSKVLQASLLVVAALLIKEGHLPLVLDEVHVTLADFVAAAVCLYDQLRELVNKLALHSVQQHSKQQQQQQVLCHTS
jgi:hypothetical protein